MTEETKTVELPEVQIEALSTPYRAIVPVEYKELREAFDEFWAKNGEFLASNYKGKKGKGGKVDLKKAQKALEANMGLSKLYMQVIVDKATKEVRKTSNKDVLFVIEGSVQNFEEDKLPLLVLQYNFWPELTFNGELTFNLTRQMPRNFEESFKQRCEDLVQSNTIRNPFEGEKLEKEHSVLIDVIASCDGKPYEEGSVRGQWTTVADMMVPELIEAILSHKKGDLFEVSFANPFDGDLKDKTVEAHVKIHDVNTVTYLDADNDKLYTAVHCETKQEFKEKFEREFNAYMDNADKHQAFNDIIQQIAMNSTRETPPDRYMDLQVDSQLSQYYEKFNNDKQKALESVGAKSEEELAQIAYGQTLQDLIKQMAVKWYATKFDLDDNEPDTISQHIITKVNWVEPVKNNSEES